MINPDFISDMPLWLACLIAFLLVGGAFLTFMGNVGLLTFKNFYERTHAPAMGATLGAGGILIAAIIHFSVKSGGLMLFPVLIAVFMTVTTPVTLILLARTAVYRDRTEDNGETVPQDEQ